MASDEERARDLIAELRQQAMEKNGGREYFHVKKIADWLGCAETEATAAILHADAKGWVRAHRAFGAGVMGVTLLPTGFAEAGKSPSPQVPAQVQHNHHGDVVSGDKFEIHGDKNTTKKVTKTKNVAREHTGDNNVSTKFSLIAWFRRLLGFE